MNTKQLLLTGLSLVIVSVIILTTYVYHGSAQSPPPPLDSPLPTPTATPIPSEDAQIALDYLAAQQQLPREELQIIGEETITFTQLVRTYTVVTIIHDQPDRFQSYTLLVNQSTKEVSEDLNALRAAEAEALRAMYGKLEPDLYDHLQTIGDDELVPIAVWAIQGADEPTPDVIAAELAQRYPEAAKVLAEQGIVWAVDDPELRTQIEQEYNQALTAATAERVQPIIDWLREKGYVVEELPGSPSVAATVRNADLLELAELEQVSQIFLMGSKTEPESDIAVPTDHVPTVWARGFTGTNVKLALVEEGNINPTASSCMNISVRRDYALASSTHKSQVASIAACNDPILRGVAYGAQILDAGHIGNETAAAAALLWAVNNNAADVTNQSEQIQTDTALHYLDKLYDFMIRYYMFTAVKSAGNTSGNVTSPGKGWNIITVGNSNDKGNANWADDDRYSTSSYINPNTNAEKPEVVAPGTNINTVVGQDTGTSLAAPQVAGLAALLMQRNGTLKDWPSVVKAIIMASAVHNIEGDSRLSDKDGAGGIDAALADQIAQTQGGTGTCTMPCWWNINTNTTTPPLNTNLERTFQVSQGERVRVVIAWLSQADRNGTTDNLLTNYDLYIRRSDNTLVTSSASTSNNFEIVEFTAPVSGQYKLQVYRNSSGDSNEASNRLGIAWGKDATYLSDIRGNSNGTSRLYVRSEAATQRSTKVTFYNTNGTVHSDTSNLINPNAVWVVVPPNNWAGAAIIDGGEMLTAMVEQVKTSPEDRVSAYTGMRMMGDPGWELAAPTLYLPYVYKSYAGFTSDIHIFNPGPMNVNVDVTAYDVAGNTAGNLSSGLNAGMSTVVQPLTANNFFGSAKIASTPSSQPLVVVANHQNGNIDISTMAASGGSPGYLPYIFKNYTGNVPVPPTPTPPPWDSCFTTRNTATSTNAVLFAYYWNGGLHTESQSINVDATLTKCQSGNGSLPNNNNTLAGRVGSTNTPVPLPLAVAINQGNATQGKHMSYNATSQYTKLVIIPNLRKNDTVGGLTWTSGFQVQAAAASAACIKITLYKSDGSSPTAVPSGGGCDSIPSGTSKGYYMGSIAVADGLWSAVISSDQPIAAVGNATCTSSGCLGDTVYAYNPINR